MKCNTCHDAGAINVYCRCAGHKGAACGLCQGYRTFTTGCPDCAAGARWGRIEGAAGLRKVEVGQ